MLFMHHTAATPRTPLRQRMTVDFAPAFLRTAKRQQQGYIRDGSPLCTFSLVRFFDVCQRNEQKTYMPISLARPKEIGNIKIIFFLSKATLFFHSATYFYIKYCFPYLLFFLIYDIIYYILFRMLSD
jgi:hypothetical protein